MKIFTSLLAVCLLAGIIAAMPIDSQMSTLLYGAAAAQQTTAPAKTADDAKKQQSDSEKQRIAIAARNLLARSRTTLEGFKTYKTGLDEEVNVGGQKFTASGEYIKGPDLKHRLELKLEIGSGSQKTNASLIQVCDGQILKSEQQVGKVKMTSRRNVRQILDAATPKQGRQPNAQQQLIADMGIGGITGLIASLENTMVFDSQESVTTGKQKAYLLEGGWNAAMQKYWIELNGGAIPTHVPDRVRVLIDSEFFVRQIEYLKLDRKDKTKKPTTMLSLKFRGIQVNPKVDDKTFEYEFDRSIFTEDVTNRYIQMINAAKSGTSP